MSCGTFVVSESRGFLEPVWVCVDQFIADENLLPSLSTGQFKAPTMCNVHNLGLDEKVQVPGDEQGAWKNSVQKCPEWKTDTTTFVL